LLSSDATFLSLQEQREAAKAALAATKKRALNMKSQQTE